MLTAIALILAVEATAASPAPVEPNPAKMTRAEIRAHNAELAKTDPSYIRCERKEEIGSLVARKSTCRTNRQWAALEKTDHDRIRGIGDEIVANSSSSSSN